MLYYTGTLINRPIGANNFFFEGEGLISHNYHKKCIYLVPQNFKITTNY